MGAYCTKISLKINLSVLQVTKINTFISVVLRIVFGDTSLTKNSFYSQDRKVPTTIKLSPSDLSD